MRKRCWVCNKRVMRNWITLLRFGWFSVVLYGDGFNRMFEDGLGGPS